MDQETKKEFDNLTDGLKSLTSEVKSSKTDIQNLTVGLNNLTQEVQGSKKEFENLTQIIQESFSHVEGEIASVKEDLANVKITMATKTDLGKLNIELRDFIDDKIDGLKDDWVIMMRKEDTKLVSVVETLRKKDVFGEKETDKILKMEPFPRLIKSI